MAKLTAVFVILSMYLYGVFTQHAHVHTHGSPNDNDYFTISVEYPKQNFPEWSITRAHRAENQIIDTIAKAITAWGHPIMSNPAKQAELRNQFIGDDFQGLKIVHIYNHGKEKHTLYLPKCVKTVLGTYIISETVNKLTATQKNMLKNKISGCAGNTKQ